MDSPPPLILDLYDARTRVHTRQAFLRSPVRVGRAPENELVVDAPFVSARHGIFQFDDAEVRYADLGSRNGTLLGGRRLGPDVPFAIAAGESLVLGSLRIEVSRGQPPPAPPAEPRIEPGVLTALLGQLAATPPVDAADAMAFALRPGLVLNRFELVREIGHGGFGVVWEARDLRLGRCVAIKALRPGAGGARLGRSGLQREAEAIAALAHPNVVSLYDVGTWEGGMYLIMELLRGESLEARLRRGPLSVDEALACAIDVARALAIAHGAGLIHRDLKPSNVHLADGGFAKVLDFGLAHLLGAGDAVAAGTPLYMAPEQQRGAPPDPRADVYAAALVLRESLLGSEPAERKAKVAEAKVPEAVAPLLERALAADPLVRPRDGRAWLEELLAAQRRAWHESASA